MKGIESKIKMALEYSNNIIATLREPFLVLDKTLRVISANQAFYNNFEVAEKDTIGRLLPDLGNRQWNIPKLFQLLKEIIPGKKVVKDYEIEHKFEQIGKRIMLLNARQIRIPEEITGVREEELILLAIEDITERKRLQEELKMSEERYRRAFETSRDGLLLIHKTGAGILNSNASAQELLGYSHEELLKKKLWEIGVTKDDKDFQETLSKLEKDGVIHYEDIPIRTKKGLSVDSEVFLVDKAKVIQCNIRDITIHKKEEVEALKESEMRFKTIFNDSADGMLLVDVGTRRFFMCNPKICQILGYAEEELMRMGFDDIHPWKDLLFVMERFVQQTIGETKPIAGFPVKRKNGSVFYADVNTSLITLAGRKYLMGSFRDITARKKAEDELEASEASYRAIFESANDAIIVKDISTYEIVDANNKAREMLCYPKEEIIGLSLEAFSVNSVQHPIEKLKSFYEKASKGEPQLFEWLAKDKFGREFWVEINAKLAIIGGQRRLLYIARDITERKQLLEQKDSFMNMVSHELRTPLGAIKESIALTAEGNIGALNEKQKEMIDIAKRNVDRLARLIDEVLDLQKIDAGRMELKLDENDMNGIIKEVYRTMISLASKKGLSFILELDDKLPNVKFDKDRIIEVLSNIINNAIKFTEKGDITITSTQGNNFIRVSVKDTGIGVKTEDLPKLFQRFSQLERKPGGSGLGLAISKEIIDLHKGKIGIESEFGKGTTFYFILPIHERRV